VGGWIGLRGSTSKRRVNVDGSGYADDGRRRVAVVAGLSDRGFQTAQLGCGVVGLVGRVRLLAGVWFAGWVYSVQLVIASRDDRSCCDLCVRKPGSSGVAGLVVCARTADVADVGGRSRDRMFGSANHDLRRRARASRARVGSRLRVPNASVRVTISS